MDIQALRDALSSGVPVEYKSHCLKRMVERDISRESVVNCIMLGEVIEDYPLAEDNTSESSFPACLILSIDIKDGALHVVVGFNGRKIIIISVYRPDKEHWEDDFKTRRKENKNV